jgi:SAM-dependent methyltransferase
MPEYGERWDIFCTLPRNVGSILDVGCGAGIGFQTQRQAGIRVVGIDFDPEAISRATARLDRAVVIDVEQADWAARIGERFDVVAFCDCLEHLVNPWKVLSETRALLNSGGLAVASIPNVRQWRVLAKAALGRWEYQYGAGTVQRGHLRFFTRSTVDDMFLEAGYNRPKHYFPSQTFHCGGLDRLLHDATLRRLPELWYGSYTVAASVCSPAPA